MAAPIFALSSGPPPAGVAVIRLSGEGVFDIVRQISGSRRLPPTREARLRTLRRPHDQAPLDQALVLIFPGPNSFTGEDSAELHCHGSPAVVAAVQAALSALGARPAEAGEFTRRAFESGRLDLTQVEALSDLIVAETELQRETALAQAGGRLRDLADSWRDQLIGIMAEIEAQLDFSDEGDVEASNVYAERMRGGPLTRLVDSMEAALHSAPVGERIRHGLTIAVTGPPNAGKSSLINALARRDVAIVTPHAGTTRDVIEVHLDLGGRPAILLDTAGLRETSDPIEAEGIARAIARAESADLVLNLAPGGNVVNRIDETGETPGFHSGRLHLSARTGAGLAELEAWLTEWAEDHIPSGEPPAITTARQQHLIAEALGALKSAQSKADPVLTAEDLRAAAHALGRLSGRIGPEVILGAIFSRFCIGK
ncbi:tRNA uridine-5-carboxymethylaminomethyl(34) synthesis GTPase MnmE [Sandaracinobacter neustonicus]|uniref:tRNA modification GTPase MnmE n=1 Tax=Sandaracinobacter neustonicus TaxID=1715348 RepID=A0A501XRW7_9SPHN|nr:tRNA uridine-5-carboxymethylaminomethyl(34) synthesis GTPase MnmE [Sandaracinobacter neustonicus]TPE63306.1 tRNA uridine-5-carboxymethylaminomethyl(34) synthesis GTPase MnmE [Sandaracinobacter neustonicus]